MRKRKKKNVFNRHYLTFCTFIHVLKVSLFLQISKKNGDRESYIFSFHKTSFSYQLRMKDILKYPMNIFVHSWFSVNPSIFPKLQNVNLKKTYNPKHETIKDTIPVSKLILHKCNKSNIILHVRIFLKHARHQ